MSLVTMNFESQYLNGNTTISVILPDKPRNQRAEEFYESGRKYKVLWLLHGGFGDYSDWLRKSSIELYASEKNLIVVMPSALNSGYTNWSNDMMGYFMFDYFFKELMPLIYNWFPASDKRKDNFIAGLSMGGGGTLKYALSHPEKFSAAACLSAAPSNPHDVDTDSNSPINKRFMIEVNNMGGMEAYLKSHNNTWDKLAEYVGKKTLPKLYFACGTDDFGFERYLKFKKYIKKLSLPAAFEEIKGYGHEWRFWDLTIQHALTFFGLDKQDDGNANRQGK
jgi:S-formylglutathione hydrolase FrmB